MNARSPHDHLVASKADGYSQDFYDSDSERGRERIAEREKEDQDEAWRVFIRQIAGEMIAAEREQRRADDQTILKAAGVADENQRKAMLEATTTLLGEHEREVDDAFAKLREDIGIAAPSPPPPTPSNSDALEARVAAIEADLVTINATITSLSEQIATVMPPVPVGAAFSLGKARGLHDPNGTYKALDHVAADGQTWVAKRDDPGPLPGDGWMLGARAGKSGRPGKPGVSIAGISTEGSTLVIAMSDGHKARCDLAPVVDAMLARKHVA